MKRFFCIILALILVFAISACGGSSDEPKLSSSGTDVIPATQMPSPEPQPVYELYVCGIPLVLYGQPTSINVKGTEYSNGVLKLTDGTNLDSSTSNPCISFIGDMEIFISGQCSLSSAGGVTCISGGPTDEQSKSNLTISGDELKIVAADAPGISITGKLTVDGCKIDLTGSLASVYDGEIIINNDAIINFP